MNAVACPDWRRGREETEDSFQAGWSPFPRQNYGSHEKMPEVSGDFPPDPFLSASEMTPPERNG